MARIGSSRSICVADVAVVGAGLAGLNAAAQLQAAGHTVRLFEAQRSVGGRVKDVEHPGGDRVEMGANWFSPNQPLLANLISRFNLATIATFDDGAHVLSWGKRRRQFSGKLPPLGPLALMDVGRALWRFRRLEVRVGRQPVWGNGELARADCQSFEHWIDRNLVTRDGKTFFRLVSEMVFGAEASLLSLLYAIFYASRSTSLSSLITVTGGHQGLRLRDGPGVLCQELAKSLSSETLCLDHPVAQIEQDADGVVVTSPAGAQRFRSALIAVSPVATRALTFRPALTPERQRLLNAMPMGRVIKVQLTYTRPYWRDHGLSGQVMSDGYPLTYLIDNSSADGGSGVLAGFVCSSRAERFMREQNPERVLADDVAQLLGFSLPLPMSVHIEDWAANPWVGGSYGAYCPPGVMTALGRIHDTQTHPIYFCGAEHAQSHPCQMEGALESSQRSALEIHRQLANQRRS